MFSCYNFICTFEKILNFPCVLVSLKTLCTELYLRSYLYFRIANQSSLAIEMCVLSTNSKDKLTLRWHTTKEEGKCWLVHFKPGMGVNIESFIGRKATHSPLLTWSVNLTLMLLVANLANTKWCKKTWKCLKPLQMGTHLKVLSESFPMNTNMTGFRWFSKIFASLCHHWTSLCQELTPPWGGKFLFQKFEISIINMKMQDCNLYLQYQYIRSEESDTILSG